MSRAVLFSGPGGYATLSAIEHQRRKGALLRISNPRSRLNTVPPEALAEIAGALEAAESESALRFLILCGTEAAVHAGADLNMFSGGLEDEENPADFKAIHAYLQNGAALDLRLKRLSERITTVSLMHGERYGGSVEWPLMSTYSVAASDCTVQFSEVNIGFIPGWGGIVNAILKSGPANALCLGATGNRLAASDMKAIGLAAAVCEPANALQAALSIALDPPLPETSGQKRLCSEEELFRLLSERLDVHRYEALLDECRSKKQSPEELARYIDERLLQLGRPLAPLAVEAVFGLVSKGALVKPADLAAIEELVLDEAASCSNLMRTRDRVIGVNSILKARQDPLNKIPLFGRG